jgi:mono/diheme cytochrome c family protein
MRRLFLTFLAVAVVVAGGSPALAQDAKVAKGAALFESNKCTLCHGAQGKGNAKRPLDGAGGRLDPATVKLWITDPKAAEAKTGKKATPPMKSFGTLPQEEIDALVAYVMSLK